MATVVSETALSLPFSIDNSGRVSFSEDQAKIWQDRVLSVIGTTVRERVMNPNFGTKLAFALFETMDNAISEVEIEVSNAFNIQLPLLKLEKTDVSIDTYTGIINITVTYQLPNAEVVYTSLGVITLSGTNPSREASS